MSRKNKLMSESAAPLAAIETKAAEAETGATGETDVVRARVAKHELLGADGAVLADDKGEEDAHGIRYTLTANGQSIDYVYGKNPVADRMYACFGAKTLATNESSQARNSAKGSASADEQIAAVRERMGLIDGGTWVDRTRDGAGAKIDKDALAEAIVRVQIAAGAKTAKGEVVTTELAATGYKAAVRQKLEDDAAFVRKARQVPQVATEYATIVGRTTATVDDLAL